MKDGGWNSGLGFTQRINYAMEQNHELVKKLTAVVMGVFILLTLVFGFLAFRPRNIEITVSDLKENNKSTNISLQCLDSKKKIELPVHFQNKISDQQLEDIIKDIELLKKQPSNQNFDKLLDKLRGEAGKQ